METLSSDVQNRANDPARLSASDEGSPMPENKHKLNGSSYNETMVESIPSRGQRAWGTVVGEWKWIAAILSPFGLAPALWIIPATKGELETVKTDAAAHLEIAKATAAGQNEAVKAQITSLQAAITDLKSDVKDQQRDLKEILKRLPESRQGDNPPPIAASYLPKQVPAKDPSPKKAKKQPVQAQSVGSWFFPRAGN